jgi:hypothetical protein
MSEEGEQTVTPEAEKYQELTEDEFNNAAEFFIKKEDGTYEKVTKTDHTYENGKYFKEKEQAIIPGQEQQQQQEQEQEQQQEQQQEQPSTTPGQEASPLTNEQVRAVIQQVKDQENKLNTSGGRRRTKRKQQKKGGKSAKKGGKKHRKSSGKKSRRSSSKKSRRQGRK